MSCGVSGYILKIALLFAIYLNVICEENNETPFVTIKNVTYKGSLLISVNGEIIYSFRGIRYGKPPVGELRFKPPEPAVYDETEFDASQEGPACPQPGNFYKSEDCLRLNIYTKSLPNKSFVKYPVMFYMHPGGFYSVSGQSIFCGPEYLLQHDVLLVCINYRLGSLGFISTGDEYAPGNNGFKDQVLALKWIKNNIARFSGDPNNVTLMGYSAGSFSVSLHMVSPMSKGLFHRAIAMSASSYGQFKIPNHQLDLAQRQANILGCATTNSSVLIQCLRTKDADEFGNTLEKMFDFEYNPILLWLPVIEPDCGQERFLPDDPVKLIQQGHLYSVPLMTGITKYEFVGPAYALAGNTTLRNIVNQDWERIAPILFLYERSTIKSRMISKALKDFYLKSQDLENNNSSIKGFSELYADGVIGFEVHRFIDLMADYSNHPIFHYKFSYKGRYSHFYLPPDPSEMKVVGPVHHDDLIYLLTGRVFPRFNKTDDEYKIMELMSQMWTNFAIHGSPVLNTSAQNWPEYTNLSRYFMNIDTKLSIESCLYCHRYSLWDDLFKQEDIGHSM